MRLMWQKILKFNLYDLKCLLQYRHFNIKHLKLLVYSEHPWFKQFHIYGDYRRVFEDM